MDKIQTTDCYVPVDGATRDADLCLSKWDGHAWDYDGMLEKKEGIIVLTELEYEELENFKAKYQKCIDVIRRFDAGIIGMYDL